MMVGDGDLLMGDEKESGYLGCLFFSFFFEWKTRDYESAAMATTALVHILRKNCLFFFFFISPISFFYKGTTYKTVKYITF